MPEPKHKWAFMVYMAGDNGRIFEDGLQLMDNLEGYGWYNISQMSDVGSTDDVAVVAQYDTLDANETPRLFIDGSDGTGTVVEKVPPVNTGDPKNLTDFVVWSMERYPAERYALVLWNHGSGWEEDDIYEQYREVKEISEHDQVRAVRSRKRLLNRAFFLPTAAKIMSIEDDEVRAICYDDTSMDFLDNQDPIDRLWDDELEHYMNDIKALRRVLMFSQCFAGEFIDDLGNNQEVPTGTPTPPIWGDRIIMSQCQEHELSHHSYSWSHPFGTFVHLLFKCDEDRCVARFPFASLRILSLIVPVRPDIHRPQS